MLQQHQMERRKEMTTSGVNFFRRVLGPNELDVQILKELLMIQGVFFRGDLLFVLIRPITSFAIKYIYIFCSHTEAPQKN